MELLLYCAAVKRLPWFCVGSSNNRSLKPPTVSQSLEPWSAGSDLLRQNQCWFSELIVVNTESHRNMESVWTYCESKWICFHCSGLGTVSSSGDRGQCFCGDPKVIQSTDLLNIAIKKHRDVLLRTSP